MAKGHMLSGIISDKLRKLFASNDAAWTPQRGVEPPATGKTPHQGYKLGGRHRK